MLCAVVYDLLHDGFIIGIFEQVYVLAYAVYQLNILLIILGAAAGLGLEYSQIIGICVKVDLAEKSLLIYTVKHTVHIAVGRKFKTVGLIIIVLIFLADTFDVVVYIGIAAVYQHICAVACGSLQGLIGL